MEVSGGASPSDKPMGDPNRRDRVRRRLAWAALALLAGIAGVVGVMFALPASTPAIRDATGAVVPGSIASVESVQLNGVQQWLVIRGRSQANPVLLYLHGGPGTPETAPLTHYDGALEADFTVVCWDQRGAGKSYPAGQAAPDAVTVGELLADTHSLTTYLRERFHQDRIYLAAHSFATILAMRAVQRWPDDYRALISIEQTSDAVHEEQAMHAWVLDQARRDANDQALRDLVGLTPGSLLISEREVRLKWIEHYGGGVIHKPGGLDELTRVVLFSPEYTVAEKLSYQAGVDFTLSHLFPDGKVPASDLRTEIPSVDVPVYFVEGRYDELVPLAVAKAYYEVLDAPHKEFVVFEHSAHSPPFEEPEAFCSFMHRVLVETT